MKKTTRRKFTPEFKAKVAIDALKERMTLAELSEKYEISASQISRWKQEFLDNASAAFREIPYTEERFQAERDRLYSKIGELEMELDLTSFLSAAFGKESELSLRLFAR